MLIARYSFPLFLLALLAAPAADVQAQCRYYYLSHGSRSGSGYYWTINQINASGALEWSVIPEGRVEEKTSFALDQTAGSEVLFYTSPSAGRIYSNNLFGTAEHVAAEVGGTPTAMALDAVRAVIYYADATDESLRRVGLDGSPVQTIINNVSDVSSLILDADQQRLFWTEDREATGAIRSVNTDGSQLAELATELRSPKGIAFDSHSGTLYWTTQGVTEGWRVTQPSAVHRLTIGAAQSTVFRELENVRWYVGYRPPQYIEFAATPRDLFFEQSTRQLYYTGDGTLLLFDEDGANHRVVARANVWRVALLNASATVCGNAVDYSSDRTLDFAVWRPHHIDYLSGGQSVGLWFASGSPYPRNQTMWFQFAIHMWQWGLPGDLPVQGDHDGDGAYDLAVWRPADGTWYVLPSLLRSFGPRDQIQLIQQFGLPGDYPLKGDFDSDGVHDYIVWRPASGMWYILRSSDAQMAAIQWGLPGDYPLIGDFDGDEKDDLAAWRPSSGTWYVLQSSRGFSKESGGYIIKQWGLPEDEPMQGDFNGDGRLDFVVWRPSEGTWYVCVPSAQSDCSEQIVEQFGLPGDIPISGDFDGDHASDFVVFRPQLGGAIGMWHIRSSSSGEAFEKQFGLPGDIPLGLGIRSAVRFLYGPQAR